LPFPRAGLAFAVELIHASPMRPLIPAGLILLLGTGCMNRLEFAMPGEPKEPVAAAVPAAQTMSAVTATAQDSKPSYGYPIGEVTPPPSGSLQVIFYAPDDESPIVRLDSGRIGSVKLPSGGVEPVLAHVDYDQADTLVYRIDNSLRNEDYYDLEHIPSYEAQNYMPSPASWEYLNRYLKDGDQIWTFGDNECGILVIRDNHIFCVMVHSDQPPISHRGGS